MDTKGHKFNEPQAKQRLTIVGQDRVLMNDDHRNTCVNVLSAVEGRRVSLKYQK